MSKFVNIIVGVALVVGTIVTGGVLGAAAAAAGTAIPGWFVALAPALISAGSGMVLSGIGTLLQGGSPNAGAAVGLAQATRNAVAPWNVVYGRAKVGGTIIHIHSFGDSDKYLDLVMVLACHQCKSVWALLFDGQRVQIDPSNNTSFTPVEQTVNITTISRSNNVVTVVLNANIPYLMAGDYFYTQNVTGDYTMNGKWPVEQIISRTTSGAGSVTFTYLLGGTACSFSGQGQIKTAWPDYGRKVYFEALLGNHTATFTGMLNGTPNDGDTGDLIQDGSNPWTAAHKGLGKTMVFVRLHYNDTIFAGGIPQISFLVSGKNDIYDPRLGAYGDGDTTAYTENAALCIADYLSNSTWGFKAAYGTEIPLAQLVAAANVCDETVTLAVGSTEPRYTVNGTFPLSVKRGEVLQNLLTSCGGRVTYNGGQFVIWPAAWFGVGYRLGAPLIVPATAGTFVFDFEDQVNGGDHQYHNGRVQITFDGSGGATMSYLGVTGFTSNSNNFGVNGTALVGATAGAGPVSFTPPAPGQELKVQIFSPDGTWATGAAYDNSDGTAHAYLVSAPTDYVALTINGVGHFAGSFRWKTTVPIRDVYNGVKGVYVSPGNRWQPSDFPPYAQDTLHGYSSDANLTADGGDRRWLDIQLPFTISAATAQRLAKIELLRRRHYGTGTFLLDMHGYQISSLDVISMTLPFLGWTNKLLEVTAHRLKFDKQDTGNGLEATCLGVEIDVQETDPSIYDWTSTEELNMQGYQQAAPPVVQPISGISISTSAGDMNVSGSAGAQTATPVASQYTIHDLSPTDTTVIGAPDIAADGLYYVRVTQGATVQQVTFDPTVYRNATDLNQYLTTPNTKSRFQFNLESDGTYEILGAPLTLSN